MAGLGAGIVRLMTFALIALVGLVVGVIAAAATDGAWPQRLAIALAVPAGAIALAYAVDWIGRRRQ